MIITITTPIQLHAAAVRFLARARRAKIKGRTFHSCVWAWTFVPATVRPCATALARDFWRRWSIGLVFRLVRVTGSGFWPGSWIAVSLGFRLLCASSHRNRCCLQKPFVRGPIFVGWLLQWQRRPWRFSRQHCCVLKPQVGEIRSRIGGGKPLFDGVQAGLGSWSTCWFPTQTFQAQLPESFQASPANR